MEYTAGSGQREPSRLVLDVGETSTLQAAISLGGSRWRWPDPAVYSYMDKIF